MSIIIFVRDRLIVLCYSLEAELNRLFWTLQTTHYFMTSLRTTRLSMLCLWRYLLLTYLTISVIRSSGHRA